MSDYRGVDVTNLSVRLPVKMVTHLYASAIKQNRKPSTVVFKALESWFKEGNSINSKSTLSKSKSRSRGDDLTTLSVTLPIKIVAHLYSTAINENMKISVIVGKAMSAWFDGETLNITKTAPNNKPNRKSKAGVSPVS